MNIKRLRAAGIDYDAGVRRCLGDAQSYETVLAMFVYDDTLERAQTAYDMQENTVLFLCAHELKGVAGNMEMKRLYTAVCDLVELLRPYCDANRTLMGGSCNERELADAFDVFKEEYINTRKAVEEAI